MYAAFYLIIQGKESRYGSEPRAIELAGIRTAKKKPAVGADEIAVRVELSIPDSLFRKPTLVASITMPDISEPMVTADFSTRLTELVRDQMGITLHIHPAENSEES